jgi:hypothetical protein
MKTVHSFVLAVALILCCFCLSACSGLMGHSVVLWSIPEYNLQDGDIVPVYIKSSISQVYVIGVPGTKEKIEVPLWQITDPESKSKTKKNALKYEEYKHQYAKVVLDGLPMRSDPVNTARQVYRLRKDETIKVLYKGEGAAVMAGSKAMEGDWLRVLASDGTYGWCFSYNLRLFDEREQGSQNQEIIEEVDELLTKVLAKRWYPESYSTMIKRKNINLNEMKREYGFDTGSESGFISLVMKDLSVSYPFEGITNTSKNVYKFNDAPFTMTVRNENFIIIQYTNEKGMPYSFNFISLSTSVDSLIQGELERRANLYESILAFGPNFSSSNYGNLSFQSGNLFSWKGFKLLVDSGLIPRGSANEGTVELQYFVDSALSFQFDGVISFKFSGSSEEIHFLYKLEEAGIRLENTNTSHMKNGVVIERTQNPLVIFFAKTE